MQNYTYALTISKLSSEINGKAKKKKYVINTNAKDNGWQIHSFKTCVSTPQSSDDDLQIVLTHSRVGSEHSNTKLSSNIWYIRVKRKKRRKEEWRERFEKTRMAPLISPSP